MSGAGRSEAGYSLVALLAAVAVMMVMLGAAVPSWRYVMRNDAEEELIFRGGEIADAVARYQRKNGNALPPTIEVLVKGKYLRRAYKDPMTKHGRWRFIRPGETPGAAPPGAPANLGTSTSTRTPAATPTPPSSPGQTVGPIQGVASTSTEKSLRVFNGRTRYNEWIFLPGQPRVVGRPIGPPAGRPPGTPPQTRPTSPGSSLP